MKPIDTFEKAWTLYKLGIPLYWGDFARLTSADFPSPHVTRSWYSEEVMRLHFEKYGLAVEVEEADDE